MFSLIGALLSAFGFGSANVVIKKSLTNLSIAETLFPATLSGVAFLSILTIFSGFESFSYKIVLSTFVLASLEVTLYYVLYRTFEIANVSVATSVISIYPLGSLLFSIIFLGDSLPYSKILFIVLIILGAILTSIKWEDVFKNGLDKGDIVKGFKWMIVTLIMHAIYYPILGEFTSQGIWEYRLLLIKIFAVFVLFMLFHFKQKVRFIPSKKYIPSVVLLGFLEVLGWVGYSWAVSFKTLIPQSIIIALLSSMALVTAVGAYIFIGEKLSKLQYVGIIIIVISLAALV